MKKFLTVLTALAAMSSAVLSAQDEKTISIVAHRGFWNCEEAGFAKNSVAALRCAQEAGFWGSEFDVNMSADSVLLVFHDGSINSKRINDYPASEFADIRLKNGEPIPTLDDYLKQAQKHPETVLVFEIKGAKTPELERTCTDLCIAKLKEYDFFEPSKTIFISFSLNVCEHLVANAPGFTIQYLDNDVRPTELKEKGINGIDSSYGKFYSDKEWLPEARANGLSVNVWTVDDKKDIVKMLDMGVDMITTNFPIRTREIAEKKGLIENLGTIAMGYQE